MHALLSRPWRHRLLAAHVAAGAGMLGAGVALLVWSGGGLARANAVVIALIAHLALLAAVLGFLAFARIWHRGSGKVSHGRADPAPRHRTASQE